MCLEEPTERYLAGSPPSSGFGFIHPSLTGLGRPNCTDGHLAGTLGYGPVLTHSLLLLPPFSAPVALSTLQRSDWTRAERLRAVVGLRHWPVAELDRSLEENPRLYCPKRRPGGQAGGPQNAGAVGLLLVGDSTHVRSSMAP